jgi:Icc-related predicted phosphoesterase
MKILHISDTHAAHQSLKLNLQGIDVLVHTGDATNYWNSVFNEKEFYDFLEWYSSLDALKIYVAGNHDSYIFKNEKLCRKLFAEHNIIYLNKEEITIDGVVFYGDPTSPTFGNWFFQSNRGKMERHWNLIPKHTQVLLTHTPPQQILDISFDFNNNLQQVGCSNLSKKVFEIPNLILNCFGHVHNHPRIKSNVGVLTRDYIQFSNAACVVDGKFDLGCVHHGNYIEI